MNTKHEYCVSDGAWFQRVSSLEVALDRIDRDHSLGLMIDGREFKRL